MNDPDVIKIRPDDMTKDEMSLSPLVKLSEKKETEITGWLREYIPELQRNREADFKSRGKYQATLRGERSTPPFRQGASNLSTPLTLWAAAALRARMRQAIVEQKPVIACTPHKARTYNDLDANTIAAGFGRIFQMEFESSRGLNGLDTVVKGVNSAVNFGTAGFKVFENVSLPRVEMNVNGVPQLSKATTKVRWDFIDPCDLIYVDGYASDTQSMPIVGHELHNVTWTELKAWEAAKQFYPKALEKVAAYYKTDVVNMPTRLRTHDIAELYLDYCVEDEGSMEYQGWPSAIVITWHLQAAVILRCAINPTPNGIRPIYIAEFDEDPDPTKARGQGVCEKLEGAQDETDAIHNLGIEAAKRATAHLIGLKGGTGAERELGGGDAVNPGDTYTSEDPDEDVSIKPLGDPAGVQVALAQEANTKMYVTRILGLDESAVGNVESGKRVPGGLGLSIQREGRAIVTNAIKSFASVLRDMVYLTGDLWKRRPPTEALAAVLEPEQIAAFNDAVFSLTEVSTREQFVLTVSAQDAATTIEQRKIELMTVNQMLFGYYDKLMQYGQMALQAPPPLQKAIALIMSKMENGVRALLNTVDSITNPSEVLPEVAILTQSIQETTAMMASSAQMMPGGQPGGARPPMAGGPQGGGPA